MKRLTRKTLNHFAKKPTPLTKRSRAEIEIKVDEGTKKAVKEYGEVFRRLAEFDRT
jgi:hypothetical protein